MRTLILSHDWISFEYIASATNNVHTVSGSAQWIRMSSDFTLKFWFILKLSISWSFSPLRPPPVQMQILAKVIDQWDNICLHNTNSISIESIRINITSRWVFLFFFRLCLVQKYIFSWILLEWDEMRWYLRYE